MPDFPNGFANPAGQPPRIPRTESALVQIWAIQAADLEGPLAQRLTSYLVPAEQDRLQAFKPPQAQRNFLVGRGCLRYLIGHILTCAPAAVPLTYAAQGKPTLPPGHSLEFNVSHSGDWVAIALAAWPLGVDIEQVRPLVDLAGLCHRCLAPEEAKAVRQLPPDQGQRQFLRYWTCKEAYAKGLGLGLALPFTSITLDLPTATLPSAPSPVAVRRGVSPGWHLYHWQVAPNYYGALAIGLNPGWQPRLALATTTPARLLATSPSELAQLRPGLGPQSPGAKAPDPGSR